MSDGKDTSETSVLKSPTTTTSIIERNVEVNFKSNIPEEPPNDSQESICLSTDDHSSSELDDDFTNETDNADIYNKPLITPNYLALNNLSKVDSNTSSLEDAEPLYSFWPVGLKSRMADLKIVINVLHKSEDAKEVCDEIKARFAGVILNIDSDKARITANYTSAAVRVGVKYMEFIDSLCKFQKENFKSVSQIVEDKI